MRAVTFTVVVALTLGAGACESAEARRERVLDEAVACQPGDTCVLAGDSDCTCGVPVNAARAAEVDEVTAAIACCDVLGSCVAVDCAAFANLRCEDGRCVGD